MNIHRSKHSTRKTAEIHDVWAKVRVTLRAASGRFGCNDIIQE